MTPRTTIRRRTSVAVSALALAALVPSAAHAATPGQLDPAFTGSTPVASFPSGDPIPGLARFADGTQIDAIAAQPDGKVVAVGSTGAGSTLRPYAVRLNVNGTTDESFQPQLPGPGVAPGSTGLDLTGVAIDSTGRVVLSGTAHDGGLANGAVGVRLNPDGSADTAFDTDGTQVLAGGFNRQGAADAVAVGPGDTVVLGGSSVTTAADGDPAATVLRLTAGGAPDAGPLGSGVRVAPAGRIRALAIDPNGLIVAAGQQKVGLATQGLVARLKPDGGLDGSFRGGGVFSEALGRSGAYSSLESVVARGDGRIVAGGVVREDGAPSASAVVVRLQSTGAADVFGDAGRRYVTAAPDDTSPDLVPGAFGVVASGDRTYLTGFSDDNGTSRLSTSALDGNGNLDTGFGSGGTTTTAFTLSTSSRGAAAALTNDGLLVAGTAFNSLGTPYGFVGRYGAPAPEGTGTPGGGGGGGGGGGTPGGPGPDTNTPGVPGPGTNPPGGDTGKPTEPQPKPKAPVLTKLKLTKKAITPKRTATLSFTVSTAGKVQLTVQKPTSGRKTTTGTGKKRKTACAKRSSENTKGKRCTYYEAQPGRRTVTVKKGSNKIELTTKVAGRKLKPGTYRLSVLPVDPTGKTTGVARTVTLKIARR